MAVCSADSESHAENEHFEGLLFHSQPYSVETVPLMLLFSPREATHAQNASFVDKFLTLSLYLIAFHHCWQFCLLSTAVNCCEDILCPRLLPEQTVALTLMLSLLTCCSSWAERVLIYSYLLYGIAVSCYSKCCWVPGYIYTAVIPVEPEDKLNNDMLCSSFRSTVCVCVFTINAANSILLCTYN